MSLSIVSICAVIEDDFDAASIASLSAAIQSIDARRELVLVANGVGAPVTKLLLDAIDDFSDATLHFLDRQVERDAARLVAMDNAIGDLVLLIETQQPAPQLWRAMITSGLAGADHVYPADSEIPVAKEALTHMLFRRLYQNLAGVAMLTRSPRNLLLSRAAAVYVLSRRDGEILLKAEQIGPGFASQALPGGDRRDGPRRRFGESLGKAYRVLRRTESLPVRAVVLAAAMAAVGNLLYTAYVLFSLFAVDNLAPGWATLSLSMNGMFFLLFVLLGLIGDHLAAIERATAYRLRYTIVREVRSKRTERQLNLVTEQEHRSGLRD